MPKWSIEFDEEALEDLEKLSSAIRRGVLEKVSWLREHFENVTPQPLGATWHGFFKLRIGDYRAIYEINWRTFCFTIVLVDHRSRVYKRRPRIGK